ncbi:hypothetical protein CDAR_191461 [Caerostris darwini]|uniref:Uncharacterized protein n=1 Tax=Caerostris darwini TaxID=1538125 RepID=A0AAV4XBI3_9ARAC|nr:hypothetical protein CDAR_191461 [Caerostris darwini]
MQMLNLQRIIPDCFKDSSRHQKILPKATLSHSSTAQQKQAAIIRIDSSHSRLQLHENSTITYLETCSSRLVNNSFQWKTLPSTGKSIFIFERGFSEKRAK